MLILLENDETVGEVRVLLIYFGGARARSTADFPERARRRRLLARGDFTRRCIARRRAPKMHRVSAGGLRAGIRFTDQIRERRITCDYV